MISNQMISNQSQNCIPIQLRHILQWKDCPGRKCKILVLITIYLTKSNYSMKLNFDLNSNLNVGAGKINLIFIYIINIIIQELTCHLECLFVTEGIIDIWKTQFQRIPCSNVFLEHLMRLKIYIYIIYRDCTEAEIQLLLKRFPDFSVSSLIRTGWCGRASRHQNSLQYPWVDNWQMAIFPLSGWKIM